MVVFKCNEAANKELIRLLVFSSAPTNCAQHKCANHSSLALLLQD